MTNTFIFFHLNLAYSSIEVEARPTVITRCYDPILDLAERLSIPVGIELSGWTLEQITQLSPSWVDRFKHLQQAGICELIGSGYAQIIGPLVPYKVNKHNQQLGLEVYQRILGITPRLAMLNELAYSSGMVGVYNEMGYKGLIMDRDNVALALGLSDYEVEMPSHAIGDDDAVLPVLWSDSILFQKFQRFAHGDISASDYFTYFNKRLDTASGSLAIYGNDAEIFDYRPGRYKEEPDINHQNEWQRIGQLLELIAKKQTVSWLAPSRVLEKQASAKTAHPARLTATHQPIPVKKQAKYNISRWAVSGRDDLWINTVCHSIFKQLSNSNKKNKERWRDVCLFWGSDLRTHITESRWQALLAKLNELGYQTIHTNIPVIDQRIAPRTENSVVTATIPACHIERDPESIYITIQTDALRVVVNQRRGLTLQTLGFKRHDYEPLLGTLSQGYFNSIELGADFYSGGVIIEQAKAHSRVTDLRRTDPEISDSENECRIRGVIETDCGSIVKTIIVSKNTEKIQITYEFPGWQRPYGTVRLGNFTLLPDAFAPALYFRCMNGGKHMEEFELKTESSHSSPASTLVSASTGLGATNGEIIVGDRKKMLRFKWDPTQCAAFPMIYHKKSKPNSLLRLIFSLSELDETRVEGGHLLPFSVLIEPYKANDRQSWF